MKHAPNETQITRETTVREVAALERAAHGLEHAFAADRVYCGVLEGESLRFSAVAPAGSRMPGDVDPAAIPGMDEVLSGMVAHVEATSPFDCPGLCVAVPFISRGEVLGAAVLAMGDESKAIDEDVLALVGATIGEALASLRDRTVLQRRLSEMREDAAVLDALIETSGEAVKLLDLDGAVLRWNPAAERLYGWAEPEVLGERLPQVPEGRRLRAMRDIRHIAAGGVPVGRDAVNVGKDGRLFTVALTVMPVTDAEGDPVGVLSIARPAVTDGGSDMRARPDVSGVMARTLKGALTSVAGYAQLLAREEILTDTSRRVRTVAALEERAAVISDLIDTVVLISQLEDEGRLSAAEPADMAGLITDVVGRFEQLGPGHVIIDYEPGLAPVDADAGLLARALGVLLRASASRAGMAPVVVSVVSEGEGVSVAIGTGGVSDGAEAEALRPEDTIAADATGDEEAVSWLEMHLARRIIEAHGGTVGAVMNDRDLTYRVHVPMGARR